MRFASAACFGVLWGLACVGRSPNAQAADDPVTWAAWSASPVALDSATRTGIDSEVASACGGEDAGLRDSARAILARKLRGAPMPEADEVARLQRAAGEPHPWARAWVLRGRDLDLGAARSSLASWLGPRPAGAFRRCGVASGWAAGGERVIAVVTIDALADLMPLPTRVRPGQWLTVEARLRVPASGAEVLVLGPSGAPRSVPCSFDGSVLRARFAPEQRGEFTVQVIADVAGGPRPVLEATVFAGVDPTAVRATMKAPGETLTNVARDDDGLWSMIGAARDASGLSHLRRDAALDAVSRKHAQRMADVHRLAHDAGDGDPTDRLRVAGVDARAAGENVAQAATVALAHRALWASPAHRANLLSTRFDRAGVGVVRDEHGDAWVVETFAGP